MGGMDRPVPRAQFFYFSTANLSTNNEAMIVIGVNINFSCNDSDARLPKVFKSRKANISQRNTVTAEPNLVVLI